MQLIYCILIILCSWMVRCFSSELSFISVPALGKSADIGHFYDVESKKFIYVRGFKGELPRNSTEFVNNPKVDFSYQRVRSFSDVLDSLKIDVTAQASLLFGRVQVSGAYGYASDVSVNTEHQQGIASYDTEKTTELLRLHKLKVVKMLNIDVGKALGATHFVVGVVWGTQSRVLIRWTSTEKAEKDSHLANLKIGVSAVSYSADVALSFGKLKQQMKGEENLEFKAYGNVALHNISLKSFDDLENFISNVPKYTEKLNGGKGSPLVYILVSLNELEKIKLYQTRLLSVVNVPLKDQIGFMKNGAEIDQLCSEIIFFYGKQQDRISVLKQNFQIISQNHGLLPDGVAERVKEQLHNFTTALNIVKMKMKIILAEAHQTTFGALEKFNSLKMNYSIDYMGSNYFDIINEEQKQYIQKINEKAWLQRLGLKIMSKMETFHQTRILAQVSTDVNFLIALNQTKAGNTTTWFQNVDKIVQLQGSKFFVDCELPEIRKSSCMDFIHTVNAGSIIRVFKKFTYNYKIA